MESDEPIPQPTPNSSGRAAGRSARALVALAWLLLTALVAPAVLASSRGFAATDTPASTEAMNEYSVKAAFLLHFTRYVKWPKGTLADKPAPLVIAVLGLNPFDKILEETIRARRGDDRELVVKYFENRAALKDCHILYVPKSEESGLEQVRAIYEDRPVLLVTESISAAERGAQVGFYIENAKVRFAINESAARQARLEVSSELLKLAKIVKCEAPGFE